MAAPSPLRQWASAAGYLRDDVFQLALTWLADQGLDTVADLQSANLPASVVPGCKELQLRSKGLAKPQVATIVHLENCLLYTS